MPKFRAEPRFPLVGNRDPVITFNQHDGLALSGWYVQPVDEDAGAIVPTERELVAAIFRYVLDKYTERVETLQGDDFILLDGFENEFEIPVNVPMHFDHN